MRRHQTRGGKSSYPTTMRESLAFSATRASLQARPLALFVSRNASLANRGTTRREPASLLTDIWQASSMVKPRPADRFSSSTSLRKYRSLATSYLSSSTKSRWTPSASLNCPRGTIRISWTSNNYYCKLSLSDRRSTPSSHHLISQTVALSSFDTLCYIRYKSIPHHLFNFDYSCFNFFKCSTE